VTTNLRHGLLKAFESHDPLHVSYLSVTRTYELATREWWWPVLYEELKAYVAFCDSCQQ
jgi:Integrase zinc binding domain